MLEAEPDATRQRPRQQAPRAVAACWSVPGMTTGFLPNGWGPLLAGNTVNYTFANSQSAPNEFAIFETNSAPWGSTIVKDAITANGHTFSTFAPAQLAGFPFGDYRVVVLNWDDTFTSDFIAPVHGGHPGAGSLYQRWRRRVAASGYSGLRQFPHTLGRPGERL